MKNNDLNELTEAILRYLQNNSAKQEKIIEEFSSKIYNENTIMAHMRVLENKKYVKKQNIPAFSLGGETFGVKDCYIVAPLGQSYLANKSTSSTVYSNIKNSNIAHNSSNNTQSVNISKKMPSNKKILTWLSEHLLKIVVGIIITVVGRIILSCLDSLK